jgi:hypothetical protein
MPIIKNFNNERVDIISQSTIQDYTSIHLFNQESLQRKLHMSSTMVNLYLIKSIFRTIQILFINTTYNLYRLNIYLQKKIYSI